MSVLPQLGMMAGELYPEPALALTEPPRSFSAFALTPMVPPPGAERLQWAHFAISCKACGHNAFHLGAHPVVPPAAGGSLEYTNLRPPHRLRCGRCEATEMLFDPKTDGYSGVLTGSSDAAGGDPVEIFTPTAMPTFVVATYNIQLQELKELAALAGDEVKPTDLFDWINIIQAAPPGDEYYLELDYSCT
jgi:hypothetical protein